MDIDVGDYTVRCDRQMNIWLSTQRNGKWLVIVCARSSMTGSPDISNDLHLGNIGRIQIAVLDVKYVDTGNFGLCYMTGTTVRWQNYGCYYTVKY